MKNIKENLKIDGYMTEEELLCLYDLAKDRKNILEIGSFKGRSTFALCSTGSNVTAVDSWVLDFNPESEINGEKVYQEFLKNTKEFTNLTTVRADAEVAIKEYEQETFDMIFLDFRTEYNDYVKDLNMCLPRLKQGGIIVGHEYSKDWSGVTKAVDERFNKPDGVVGMIWWKII